MKIAVIGAGPCGLATLKTLRESGLDAHGFEAGMRVGGQWVLDNPSGTSAAYHSLRTNTSRAMSRFSDYAFPDDYPDHPGHAQMAAWFEAYAKRFGLLDAIEFDARVASVEPLRATSDAARRDGSSDARAGGGYLLTVAGRAPERFEAVIAATGSLWDPVQPTIPGRFEGATLHAKDYRDATRPLDLRGRRVLVVGLGNSGCEIAAELSRDAEVLLSARTGNAIFPRLAPGRVAPPHPADPLPALFRALPVPIRDALFRRVFPRALARLTAALPRPETLGLPPAPRDPFEKRSIVNDEILGLLAQGRVRAKPGLVALHGPEVGFADGSRAAVDAIVWATGYRFSLPYLSREVLGVDDPNDLRLYQGILHPHHPGLFVVGVMRVFCSIWPMAEQQAKWIAALLRGDFKLPSAHVLERRAYPILRGPFRHCPFRAHDLRREAGRG